MKYAHHVAVAAAMPRRDPMDTDAPCVGRHYDTDLPRNSNRYSRAELLRRMAPALALCAACPFTRECLARVAPRESYYDGVCAGHVWRNGACVTEPGIGRPRDNVAVAS